MFYELGSAVNKPVNGEESADGLAKEGHQVIQQYEYIYYLAEDVILIVQLMRSAVFYFGGKSFSKFAGMTKPLTSQKKSGTL